MIKKRRKYCVPLAVVRALRSRKILCLSTGNLNQDDYKDGGAGQDVEETDGGDVFSSFLSVGAAVLMLFAASCTGIVPEASENIPDPSEDVPGTETMTVVIKSSTDGRASGNASGNRSGNGSGNASASATADESTKTGMERVLDEDTDTYNYVPYWTKGDSIGVFVRCGQESVNDNLCSASVQKDTAHKTNFSVSGITVPSQSSTYDFYAYYPYSSMSGSTFRNVRVMLPTVQYPVNGSFDPKADVLSGYPVSAQVETGSKSTKTMSVDMAFTRRSSVIVLMPSLTAQLPDGVTSETTVDEIQLTFSTAVAGVANLNIVDSSPFQLEDVGSSRTVTIKYDTGTHKLGDPIWVSVAPVQDITSLSFAFLVGDGYEYLCADADWSANPVSFPAGKVKKFTLPISNAYFKQKTGSYYYQLVDTEPDDWCGRYLIVGVSSKGYFACNQGISGNYGSYSEVTPVDGIIDFSSSRTSYEFRVVPGIAPGTYSVLDNLGKYLSAGNTTSYTVLDAPDATKTDMTLSTAGIFSATNATRQFRFSAGNGFRFYDGASVNPITLYRLNSALVGDEVEIPDVPVQEVRYRDLENNSFDVAIYNASSDPAVECDGTIVKTASISQKVGVFYTVTYTVSENTGEESRTGSVTVSCAGVSKVVSVNQECDSYNNNSLYERVGSVDDIRPGRYVIVAGTSSLTSYLPNNTAANTTPEVVTTGFEVTDDEFRTSDDATCYWKFSGTAAAMYINNAAGKYLETLKSNNQGVRISGHSDVPSDNWKIATHRSLAADNLFEFKFDGSDWSVYRFLGIGGDAAWYSYTDPENAVYTASDGSSSIKLYRMPYYAVKFKTADTDGTSIISSTTGTGTVITLGKEFVDGFTASCSVSYYSGKYGLRIGNNTSAGTFEMTVNSFYAQDLTKITVKSVQFGDDTGTLSMYINGSDTAVATDIVPGEDFVYDIPDGTTVTTIKLATSSKRAYISHIILDRR